VGSEQQLDVVSVLAGLSGVLVGLALRRRRGGSAAGGRVKIGTPTILAAPALGRVAGNALRLASDDVASRAALTFALGALLAYFAPGRIPSAGDA
jgi:hypothetical protein